MVVKVSKSSFKVVKLYTKFDNNHKFEIFVYLNNTYIARSK